MTETTDLQRLVVSLEANIKKYERELAKATGEAKKAAGEIEKSFDKANGGLSAGLATLGNSLMGTVAGALSLQQAFTLLKQTFAETSKLGDLSERLNVSTDLMQALRFATQQNAGELEDADKGLQKFSQHLGEAAKGEGELAKWFQANNVALRDKAGSLRSIDDMLVEFARLVAGAESQEIRMNMVVEAFGRQAGPGMLVALMKIAREGLPAVTDAAKELGVVMDNDLIKKAQAIQDRWEAMTLAMKTSIYSNVIAAVDDLDRSIKELFGNWANLLKAFRIGPLALLTVNEQLRKLLPVAGDPSQFPFPHEGAGVPGFVPPPGKTNLPPPKATGGGDTKDPFERQIDSLNKHITKMLADTATIGQNVAAHEQLRAETALLEAARRGETEVTDKQIAAYVQLRAQMGQEQALRAAGITLHAQDAEMFARISERVRQVASASEEAKRRFEGMNDALKFSGNELIDVIEKASQKGAKFGDIMRSVLQNITKQMLQAALIGEGAFAKLLGLSGVGGGVGGLFGLLRGTLSPGAGLPAAPAAATATAGLPVAPGTPVAAGAGRSAVGAVTLNNYIDARGADRAAVVRIEAGLNELSRTLPQRVGHIARDRQVRNLRY